MDLILKEISEFSKLYDILIWSRHSIRALSIKWWPAKILQLLTILTSKASVILLDEPLQVWMIELAIIFVSGFWRREIKEEVF